MSSDMPCKNRETFQKVYTFLKEKGRVKNIHTSVQPLSPKTTDTEFQQKWLDDCPRGEGRWTAIDPGTNTWVRGVVEGDSKEKPDVYRYMLEVSELPEQSISVCPNVTQLCTL